MPQFGGSLADNSRVIIYDRNMFIVQATGFFLQKLSKSGENPTDRIVKEKLAAAKAAWSEAARWQRYKTFCCRKLRFLVIS
jgi:hypothetical protein